MRILVDKGLLNKEYISNRKTIKTIAKQLNLNRTCIRNNLIRYNIARRTTSEAHKGIPSGMLGKHHTKETREKIRLDNLKNPRQYWKGKHFSKEHIDKIKATKKLRCPRHYVNTVCDFCGNNIKRAIEKFNPNSRHFCNMKCLGKFRRGKNNSGYGKILNNNTYYKGGYYRNIWLRSSYEIIFAYWLDLSGIKWKYEFKTFDLGNRTYTPDFYLPKFDCYIEIKGYFSNGAKKKFRLFKKKHSKANIFIFKYKNLKELGLPVGK